MIVGLEGTVAWTSTARRAAPVGSERATDGEKRWVRIRLRARSPVVVEEHDEAKRLLSFRSGAAVPMQRLLKAKGGQSYIRPPKEIRTGPKDTNMSRQERARRQLIAGLRAVADFYESNPSAYYDGLTLSLCIYVTGSAASGILATMATIFGECEQSCNASHLTVSKQFSSKVKLEIFAPCQAGGWTANSQNVKTAGRGVCQMRETTTAGVPKKSTKESAPPG